MSEPYVGPAEPRERLDSLFNPHDELVSQAEQIVQGVEPQSLRNNQVLRQTGASELAEAGRMTG